MRRQLLRHLATRADDVVASAASEAMQILGY
jgi:hypothetical protein